MRACAQPARGSAPKSDRPRNPPHFRPPSVATRTGGCGGFRRAGGRCEGGRSACARLAPTLSTQLRVTTGPGECLANGTCSVVERRACEGVNGWRRGLALGGEWAEGRNPLRTGAGSGRGQWGGGGKAPAALLGKTHRPTNPPQNLPTTRLRHTN